MSEVQQVREEVDSLRRILRERHQEVTARSALAITDQFKDVIQPRHSASYADSEKARMALSTSSIRTVQGRTQTFSNGWPYNHYVLLQPRDLAAAGLFFTPSSTVFDRVTCAYCGLELGGWGSDANVAWDAHNAGNPSCPFLSGLVKDIDADPALPQTRASGKQATEAPTLLDSVWLVSKYVDLPEAKPTHVLVSNDSVSHDVRIEACEGSSQRRQVTIEIKGAPPHGEAVRSLLISDSSYVRVLVDRVVLKVSIVNCNYVQLVIGGHAPHINIKNTTGCTLTLCPDDMDHELDTVNSVGVAVQAVPRAKMALDEGPVRPSLLLKAVDQNLHDTILIPERMVTKVSGDTMETSLVPQ